MVITYTFKRRLIIIPPLNLNTYKFMNLDFMASSDTCMQLVRQCIYNNVCLCKCVPQERTAMH